MVGISNITSADSADPLMMAINAYHAGLTAYDLAVEGKEDWIDEGDDSLLAALVCAPSLVLENWQAPATSHEAAVAAISLAEREKSIFKESPVAGAMEAAAIGYWKNAGGSYAEPRAALNVPAHVTLNDLSPDTCLTAPEAAAYLRVTDVTLARWRSAKRGPEYTKSGGRVLYRVSTLLDHVKKNERKGTRPDK